MPAVAEARAPGGTIASLKASCTSDYVRFCDGLDPRGSEVVACFRKKIGAVSPRCRRAISEHVRTSAKRSSLDTRQDNGR